MRKVIELLADPNCELFEPLVIDYNLIEVNDGVCWSLKSRSFVENPIEERQIGKVSPRAFCAYHPAKEANPKYFREILENSAVSDALLRRDNSHKKRKRLSSSQRGVKKTQSKILSTI